MCKRCFFKKDKVMTIFKNSLKVGLQLAENKQHEKVNKQNHLNFAYAIEYRDIPLRIFIYLKIGFSDDI